MDSQQRISTCPRLLPLKSSPPSPGGGPEKGTQIASFWQITCDHACFKYYARSHCLLHICIVVRNWLSCCSIFWLPSQVLDAKFLGPFSLLMHPWRMHGDNRLAIWMRLDRPNDLFLASNVDGKWWLFRTPTIPFIKSHGRPVIERTTTLLKWPSRRRHWICIDIRWRQRIYIV